MTLPFVSPESAEVSAATNTDDLKAALKLHVWRLLHSDDPQAVALRERRRRRYAPVDLLPNASASLAFPAERRLRMPEVLELTGLAASTMYRYMAQGVFPRPDELGPGTVGWKESEINEWLRTRKKRNPSPRRKKLSNVTSAPASPNSEKSHKEST